MLLEVVLALDCCLGVDFLLEAKLVKDSSLVLLIVSSSRLHVATHASAFRGSFLVLQVGHLQFKVGSGGQSLPKDPLIDPEVSVYFLEIQYDDLPSLEQVWVEVALVKGSQKFLGRIIRCQGFQHIVEVL